MCISRDEFLRLLPAAVGPVWVEEEDGLFCGADDRRKWILRFRPLSARRLGSVILPRHQIELRFEGYLDEEVEAFMARFHRGFQRGGG